MCTCEVYTCTEDRRRATAGGDIHGLGTASRVGFARMVTHDTGVYLTCLPMFSLLSLCVGSFRSTSRRCVRDQVYNARLMDILVTSGSCHPVRHLVHGWLLSIVMHTHLVIRLRD